MSRSSPLNVYVISDNSGPQKIGVSDNLELRVRALQVGRSGRLTLAVSHQREGGDARLVERNAHKLLQDKRIDGEWFDVTIDEAIAAVNEAIALVESGRADRPNKRSIPGPNAMSVLALWADGALKAEIEAAAKADGVSMSQWIAMAIRAALKTRGQAGDD